jgi:hypothetical protein
MTIRFLLRLLTEFTNILFYSVLDGLVNKCLESVPQYSQVYPAPKSDVSESLEAMIAKGFPPR